MKTAEFLPIDVVLDCDTDENKTVFTLKPLSNLENAYIRDRSTNVEAFDGKDKSAEIGLRTGTGQVLTVAFGVANVRGLVDAETGELVQPEFTEVKIGSSVCKRLTNAFIQRIPAPAFEELAVRIGEISGLTKEERDSLKSFRDAREQPAISGVSE